jgi:hypothetical protein
MLLHWPSGWQELVGDPVNPDWQVAWQDLPTATQPLQLLKVAFAGLTVGGPKQAINPQVMQAA